MAAARTGLPLANAISNAKAERKNGQKGDNYFHVANLKASENGPAVAQGHIVYAKCGQFIESFMSFLNCEAQWKLQAAQFIES